MIRADVRELLTAGYGNRTIARRLGVSTGSVERARNTLRLPAGRPGPKATSTPEDLFWRRAEPTDDGHLLWPTYTPRNGSVIKHNNIRWSVHRIAFRIGHQRAPQGRVSTGCDRPGCVHPAHVEDEPMRTQYAAIFGGAS